MPIALQQHMLAGQDLMAQWEYARALGVDGIEVDAEGLTARVPELADAIMATGIRVSAVHMGRRDGYIAPVREEREAAIGALRQAMADAVDLDAAHVVFVPHFGPTRMPDLTPYRAPVELEAEMMIWLLRTVSDLAYAMEIELDMLPVSQDQSYFMTRLDHARRFRQKIKDHPHVKIAANLGDMMLEEADCIAALGEHLPHLGYIQLAEPGGLLPGQGRLDFQAVAHSLADYDGWLTLCAPGCPSQAEIAASLDYLRRSGFASNVSQQETQP